MEILNQGVKEVSETGSLSFPTRRTLWLALGPYEERDEMDDSPRPLTEPLRKRAQLALACARKVGKVWAAYDPEDKGPQVFVKQGSAYLNGKLSVNELSEITVPFLHHFVIDLCAVTSCWLQTDAHQQPVNHPSHVHIYP